VLPDLTLPMPDDGAPIDARFDDLLGPAPDQSVPQDLSADATAPSADLAGANGNSGGCSCDVSRSAPPPWSLLLVLTAALLRRRARALK
jgi:MYXO-CTERM domain-containing protein